ncbi:uncharacterized protein FA14DRAFT_139192 [Meira miltonrushii]|uniref:Phosphatase activator n=1 Tax=Meira miltonrushii TaxID=1280837 RepID=A0A316V7B3_9BASI|nr:uncharacterized protein FA14DRAFT_139192 [Meira miltonrushii]PWN32391.1 hypothetical protein FA14DRAFT_139192 [Meira miltonrushii]
MEDISAIEDVPATRLTLDLRGSRFTIEQAMLMNLPESVLLCLFPNGLVLSRQSTAGGIAGPSSNTNAEGNEEGATDADDDEEVYMVDFDPACLSYVLRFFKGAQEDFYGLPGKPSKRAQFAQSHANQHQFGVDGDYDAFGGVPGAMPLMSKQAIIVLREELEYFSIPPKSLQNGIGISAGRKSTDSKGNPTPDVPANTVTTPALLDLKQECGSALLERKQIFTALQRNVNKENNMAEQHLIDMLCMSGFDRDDTWGFRALEPNRCCITSIALVLLKTGITFNEPNVEGKGASDAQSSTNANENSSTLGEGDVEIDQQQLNTAQKLLLFWRKPARKCWWDGVDVILPLLEGEQAVSESGKSVVSEDTSNNSGGMTTAEQELLRSGKGRRTRVWARRVWTLELSLI